MNFNPRIIEIENEAQARQELQKIGCDPMGINIMSPKSLFKTIKLENVTTKAANLLKQTFLAKGGEVAVARGTADLSIDCTDVLICATEKQYYLALQQLKMQPWGLPKAAAAIEAVLKAANSFPYREYRWADRTLSIRPGRTLVMGILNITPDSFSDGGKFNSVEAAVSRARQMEFDGADIIDIGAESTRPYGDAQTVTAEEELRRLLPILEKVLQTVTVPVSVDTYKATVAEAALRLGAHIINDVWGLQLDQGMAQVAAKFDVPVVVMHNQDGTGYNGDIMSHICSFLRSSIEHGIMAGMKPDNLIVDPGIGFGKTPADNLTVMSRLAELKSLGCPVLLGTSRKRFIGEALGGLPAGDRLEGTAATITAGIMNGVQIVRVHDVKEMKRVARVTDAIIRGEFDG